MQVKNDDVIRAVFIATDEAKQVGGGLRTDRGGGICAYVLMPNHYHMVLQTPEANLVAGMKWFQGMYTKRHNRRHKQWGHVFQGRYKAVVIDPSDTVYFRTACNYVHLNPVRAKAGVVFGWG